MQKKEEKAEASKQNLVKLKIHWHGNNYVGKSSKGRYTKEGKQGYLVTDARQALV
jgi:hypothetical protein